MKDLTEDVNYVGVDVKISFALRFLTKSFVEALKIFHNTFNKLLIFAFVHNRQRIKGINPNMKRPFQ